MSVIKRATNFIYLNRLNISLFFKRFSSAVPKEPTIIQCKEATSGVEIDIKTIEHLERLSLVDFANQEGIRRLEEAIKFANQIHSVDTNNVLPLINVLEGEFCPVREDTVTEGNIRDKILANASVTEEEYFYAPPGNIPLPDKDFSYQGK